MSLGSDDACPDHAGQGIDGPLPDREPDRIWGGNGDGSECAICKQGVARDQVEIEVVFLAGCDGGSAYRLHRHCFAAWEDRRRLQTASRGKRK
jgi:hypothetical protein